MMPERGVNEENTQKLLHNFATLDRSKDVRGTSGG